MATFTVTPTDTTFTVQVGENTLAAANSATAAEGFADDAAQSAAYAGGFETPEFASQAAGNAGTTEGQIFRVPLGTSPQTFNWFRRLSSGSEAVSPLATNAALAASGGAALVRNVRSETNAVTRTVAAVLQERPLSLMDFYNNEADLSTAFTKLNAAILASGGNRRIVMPPSGAAYRTTVGLLVSVPRVTVDVYNDLELTGTDPATLIEFVGAAHSSEAAMLQRPILNLYGCTLDGGGDGMTYTYDIADSNYNTVMFDNCTGFEINGYNGAKIINGLVDCLKIRRPFRGVARGFEASGAINDNNISVVQNPSFFDDADPSTWPQVFVEDFISHGATDNGATSYNTKGVTFRNFRIYDCGTDGASQQVITGGIVTTVGASGGGLSVEGDVTFKTNTIVENGIVSDCNNGGIAVQQGGAIIRNVTVDTIVSSSSQNIAGHGISVFAKNAGDTDCVCENVIVTAAAKRGISAIGQNPGTLRTVSLTIRGKSSIRGNGQVGIGVEGGIYTFVGPEVEHGENCTVSQTQELLVNNNVLNPPGSVARIHGKVINAGKSLLELRSVKDSEFSGMVLDNMVTGVTTQCLLIAGTTAIDRAVIQNNRVINSSAALTYIGAITGTVGDTYVGGNTGDFTNSRAVNITATVTNKKGFADVAAADPAALTYSAPSGGSTVDAESRTAIGQNAADIAEVRTHLIDLQSALRQGGVLNE